MNHRGIWWTGTALAVLAIGGTSYYWGHQQQVQKSTFVTMANTQYQGAYQILLADVEELHNAIGASLLTNDPSAFHAHVSDISKLAYASQSDLGRVPADGRSDRNFAIYLNHIDSTVHDWLQTNASPTNRTVKNQLSTYYAQSDQIISQLTQLEGQLGPRSWVNDTKSKMEARTAMTKIDDAIGAMASGQTTRPLVKNTTKAANTPKATVTTTQAIREIARLAHVTDTSGWRATLVKQRETPIYQVSGRTASSDIAAEVSGATGRIVSYNDDRTVTSSQYDFVKASKDALSWLQRMGYANVIRADASQYDHVATFTFQPVLRQRPVVNAPIHVSVALDNGQIVHYHGVNRAWRNTSQLALPKLTQAELRSKLGSDFEVRMQQSVAYETSAGQLEPATAFVGTMKEDTYRVILSDLTGKEIEVKKLV